MTIISTSIHDIHGGVFLRHDFTDLAEAQAFAETHDVYWHASKILENHWYLFEPIVIYAPKSQHARPVFTEAS